MRGRGYAVAACTTRKESVSGGLGASQGFLVILSGGTV